MHKVTRFSLVDVDTSGPRARLVRDGRALGVVVRGALLDAQFELRDGSSLLWLTEDSPYDEALHVYLLGREGDVEDALEASSDFTPGILRIDRFGDAWVEFQFFATEARYRLEVKPERQFHLLLPAGWRYEAPLRRHRLALTSAVK